MNRGTSCFYDILCLPITRSSLLILGSRLSGSISSLLAEASKAVRSDDDEMLALLTFVNNFDSTGINDGVLRSILLLLLLLGGEEVLTAAEAVLTSEAVVDIRDDEATEIEDVFAEDKVTCSILVLLI